MGDRLEVVSTHSYMEPDESGESGGAVVGLVRFNDGLDGHRELGVDVDFLADFVDQCRQMGWDQITLYLDEDDVVLAEERDVDNPGRIFAALAPKVSDEEEGDGQ